MKKSSENKKVTLIIACRNEKDIISECLDSVVAQDYPAGLTEIFVIDGMSNDGTAEILKSYEDKNSNLRVLKNQKLTQPHAFNMGIRASVGDYIFIMGAHSKYPSNYVSKCLEYAQKSGADNVGGRIEARTSSEGLIAQAIIGTYISSFGIGNATFRKDTKKPVFVDTVFGGCYRRDVFDKIGLYNETLKRSQDMELNLRLVRSGGKILLAPEIVSYYYPKDKFLDFAIYNFRAGKGPSRAARITGKPLKMMHYIPALFVVGLLFGPIVFAFDELKIFQWLYLGTLSLYLALNILFSLDYCRKSKSWKLLFLLPLMFSVRHVMYGLGTLFGMFRSQD